MLNNFDDELIRRSQKGDKVAFAQLVRTNQKMVFNLLFRLASDRTDLEDVAQEIWVKAYQSIGRIKNYSAFKVWLHRIALTTYYDKVRKNQGKQAEVSLDELISFNDEDSPVSLELVDPAPLPEEVLVNEDTKRVVEEALKSLPDPYRLILIMKDTQGLSYEEMANILEISVGTVRSRLSRAREKLLEKLGAYYKEVKKK